MMKPVLLLLAGLAVPAAGIAQPAQAPPAVQAPPASAPTPEELAESAAAVGAGDTQRLLTDAAYAADMLRHLDRLAPIHSGDADASLALDTLRVLALATLERRAEAVAVAESILARRPTDPGNYVGPWLAALSFNDAVRAAAVIEAASRDVPGVARPRLREMFDRPTVLAIFGRLQDDKPARVRLADALFRIGWPGNDDVAADDVRMILIEDRLDNNDRAGAAGLAATLATPVNLVPLMVMKRYDGLLPEGIDRFALLARAIEQRDRETAAALAAAPRDPRRMVARAEHLRSVGRNAEALAAVAPVTGDLAAAADDEEVMWAVNEAVFALAALDRNDEAARLMERIAALPLSGNNHLVNARINHLIILSSIGRHAEVLDRAARLEAEEGFSASDYGNALIASARICALASLSRAQEAAPLLARLRGWGEHNAGALSHAYMCLGDLDSAAALLVQRLGRDDPSSAILALQDYRLDTGDSESDRLGARFVSLRERPEVRAALDRVGRILSLPLAPTFWGGF
jgi:hypothetical protein